MKKGIGKDSEKVSRWYGFKIINKNCFKNGHKHKGAEC